MEKSTILLDSKTLATGDLYFLQSIDQIESHFSTSATTGLSLDSIESLQAQYGLNELNSNNGVSVWSILAAQVFNAQVLVLILACIVSLGIRSWIESGVIGAVVIVNVTVGFYSELGAAKNMASLKSLASPNAHVIRNGTSILIPTAEVCVGDLVELKTGDVVPADLRLSESMNFETDEALLTGESLPVAKDHLADYSSISAAAEIAVGDRLNMAYSSSIVTKGRAKGLVIAIGIHTEIGTIADFLRSSRNTERLLKKNDDGTAPVHRRIIFFGLVVSDSVASFLGLNKGTPLQRKLSQLAILLLIIALIFALICFAANSFRTDQEIILYAVATALSIIPASLVVVLTLTFAGGVKEMSKRRVIVRKLDSLEALGGTTHICSDKTGTLTQGKMLATSVWIPNTGTISINDINDPFNPSLGSLSFDLRSPSHQLLESNSCDITTTISTTPVTPAELLGQYHSLNPIIEVASLCNLATIVNREGEWSARGDPTECALQVLACRFPGKGRALLAETDSSVWSQVAEFPFDSELKRMTVIFKKASDHTQYAFMKGAIERVLPACTSILSNNVVKSLDEKTRIEVLANVEALATQGLRVIALAQRTWIPEDGVINRDRVENEMTLVGLVGLYDPPRLETKSAVRAAHEAGVGVIMLTGDHPTTARAIALEVGIIPRNISQLSNSDISDMVLTAVEFDRMSDDQIDKLPRLPLVIARCAPSTKVRMVEALHRRSCFVAMTGDGVNDSPALSKADVGIGMGSGSDVAKDSSDIVLTDDNFASILVAIEEGRTIAENCKRFLLHLLAENIAQAFILLIGLGFKDDAGLSVFPLAPVEILWIIMITSSFPAMGLGSCVAPEGLMKRKPHNVKIGVFTREVLVDTLVYGLIGAVLCLATFTLIVYGFGSGDLGLDSNNTLEGSDLVFRARSATFACLTWTSLILALEMLDLRRSLFRMKSKPDNPYTQWAKDIYSNRFLFWSCIGGFLSCFPVIYIPFINIVVFKHSPISWEWSLVIISSILFTVLVELWKFAKRVYYRRNEDIEIEEDLEIFREWTRPIEKIV